MKNEQPKVLIVMGSDSDYPVLKDCMQTLRDFSVDFEARVCSAHRTPDEAMALARGAESEGYDLIIAGAGMAAHLPGVLAALTTLPVIGIPIKSSFDGLDALLSIVQMPPGIPVGTMAVNGATNAGVYAVQILSLKYDHLKMSLKEYKVGLAKKVKSRNENLQKKINEEIQEK
ncbi:MAG: 5-(carboxyamino)imidazole ribonucleotide mutase [Clostridia bacterium]